MGVLWSVTKATVGLVLVIGVAIGGALSTGVIQQPTAGLEDYGDWGEVTDERTEVVTTLWVKNPNTVGVTLGDDMRASYGLYLNGVNVATGEKEGISIQSGNNSIPVSTYIQNENIPPWWVAYVQSNETIHLRAESSAHVDAGPLSTSVDLPTQRQTLLQNSKPVINALSQAAASAEGNYTKSVSVEEGPVENQATVGYEVQRGWATWGDVDTDSTTVHFHFRVHNPSRTVAVPAVPDGLGVSVDMNDVRLLRAQGEEFSPVNVDRDAVIRPGETREVVFEVRMNNTLVDEWFRSHVRNGERTRIETQLQFVYDVQGSTFRVPEEGGLTYTCDLQTAILVDDQETATDCFKPESVPGGQAAVNASETVTNRTDDDSTTTIGTETTTAETTPETETTTTATTQTTTTQTTTTVESEPPTARATANQTEGEAPLTVSFDASGSTDPNRDIERYVWQFDDGSPPENGEVVTHTFRSAGEYQVRLVVIDSEGNRDSTTITVTVERRGP